MKSHELKVESHKDRIRPGRGISAGRGKTAGRGTKGQNSRSGGKRRPGFEGGQNSIIQRLPKLRGFKSKRAEVAEIYTSHLENLEATVITHQVLADAGRIPTMHAKVKVVLNGELNKKLEVKLDKATVGAIKVIEAAGGAFIATDAPLKVKKSTEKKEA